MTNKALESIHGRLARLKVDALLFNTSEITPSSNLKYLSGFTGSDATIVISRNERRLFTDGRYKTQAHNQSPDFQISVNRNKLDSIAYFVKKLNIKKLGIEGNRVSFSFIEALQRRLPNVEFKPLSRDFLEGLRSVKQPLEKEIITKAAHIASDACRQVIEAGLEGRAEKDVAHDLENAFLIAGAEDIAFKTIVASGERGALPHGLASSKTIKSGELVVIDYGCKLDGYHSDETVTCIVGKASKEQRNIHSAVYDAHMKAFDAARAGMAVTELDSIARQVIDKAGYGGYFMHGLGHGVGMDIHEPPFLSPRGRGKLKEGMVFTIEPGIYIEGLGGVRLESLVYLDKSGAQNLSRMTKELIKID